MDVIKATRGRLISAALTNTTKRTYTKAILRYQQFMHSHFSNKRLFPVIPDTLSLYIASLHNDNLAVGSVQTHLSAINLIHKAMGGADLFQHFWVSKTLLGFRKSSPVLPDKRLPITVDILNKLCQSAEALLSAAQANLFKTMFLLSFHGFLRVGEITDTTSASENKNLLLLSNLSVAGDKTITVKFCKHKHSQNRTPFHLEIPPEEGKYTLYREMSTYLKQRGSLPGPLFVSSGKSITRTQFTQILSRCLQRAGHDPAVYKSHSFRIGAATTAITKGHTHQQVQEMGRWRSSAYKRYIRIPSFSTNQTILQNQS